jgi:hypothetical protein
MKKYIYSFILILFVSTPSMSQILDSNPDPYAAKVSTLDKTIKTLYEVISGDAGVKRDWNLFKYLFTENAHLIPTRMSEDGKPILTFLTPADYVDRAGKWLEENGFFEVELSRETDTYGSMTQIYSSYASYRTSKDQEPFARGINSIQLMNDGKRWWIVNIYWVSESDDNPIPKKYLPD